MDDGRARRPRKGDAKRERKKKALADSALKCQYYQDDHGGSHRFDLAAREGGGVCPLAPPRSPCTKLIRKPAI